MLHLSLYLQILMRHRACNKRQQTACLESIRLAATKNMLGCSSEMCNEAVSRDMGLSP